MTGMQAQPSKVLFFRLHITTTCLNDDDAKEDDGDDNYDDEKEYDSDCSSPPNAFELEVFCKTRAPINCLRSTWIITVFVSFVIMYCVFVSFAIVFVCKSGNYLSSVNQVVLFKARPDCEIVGLPSFTPPSRLVCRRARFSDAKHQSSN